MILTPRKEVRQSAEWVLSSPSRAGVATVCPLWELDECRFGRNGAVGGTFVFPSARGYSSLFESVAT